MSLTISCPSCQRTLRMPDSLLGKPIKCPGCSHKFTAKEQSEDEAPRRSTSISDRASRRPAAPSADISDRPSRRPAAPPPEDEDDLDEDRPRRKRRPALDYDDDDERREWSNRDKKAGWNKVRIGLNLIIIGIWVWLGGLLLGGLGGLLGVVLLGGAIVSSTPRGGMASLGFAGILLILSAGTFYLGVFVELVLRLIGYGMCLAVPPKRDTGLKPLAITAFSLAIAYVVFSLLNIVVGGFSGFMPSVRSQTGASLASNGISLIGSLCAVASFIVYLFFLRSVCNNTRARDQASKPIAVLIAFVCFWAVAILLVIILACAGGFAVASAMQSRSASSAANSMGAWMIIAVILVCLGGLAYMGLNVWYAMVLQNIRDAVASYRRRL